MFNDLFGGFPNMKPFFYFCFFYYAFYGAVDLIIPFFIIMEIISVEHFNLAEPLFVSRFFPL